MNLCCKTISAFVLAACSCLATDLWELARRSRDVHVFSTLLTAQDVRDRLSTEEGIDTAIEWCKKTGVTKVYVEAFRSGYRAEKAALVRAKQRFLEAGFAVSGCVTTTNVGKPTAGYKPLSCYTDKTTQEKIKSIFEYTAGLFDEIMVDDFWFTDCTCDECERARRARTVTIGERSYSVAGDRWEDYRCELMTRLSRDYILAAAKRVNSNARLIIKYPQWYDRFHERGYEVVRQTRDFDRIWVGTETRDMDKNGEPPYEAYFIMRWLGGLGGSKTGGGWFDPYSTTEKTYVEQARQTVLGGARESLLFCYGGLQKDTGPANVEVLRTRIPELLEVSREVRARQIIGISAYKPPNSHPEKESYVFDNVGMLGLPLVPCHEFPQRAEAAFFSVHSLGDPGLRAKLSRLINTGRPVLLTDGLVSGLNGGVDLKAPNVQVLSVGGQPRSLSRMPQDELDRLRAPLLHPFKRSFRAPNRVALYLFADGSWVIENFNDREARAELDGHMFSVPPRGWMMKWK